MILYPTETLYALGVNALSEAELLGLYTIKDRAQIKASSWLVRTLADIERYAEVGEEAAKIAEAFLPGKLTLVLRTLPTVPRFACAEDGTVGFRISSDPFAQEVIEEFMAEFDAPLTCTSANISGLATLGTPSEILQQFGERASMIDTIIDGGPRKGLASTVVSVVDGSVKVLREGEIAESDVKELLH